MVVSTKLKRGSLSHIRMVVAVKTISCLYEGKGPPSQEVSVLTVSAAVSLPTLLESVPGSESGVSVVLPIDDEDPSVSSEDVYRDGKNVDLDLDDVLDIDILSE